MKYPIGIQSFNEIRKDGYVYVDKTQLIYELTHSGKFFFLSRPRRFGKSLLLSTLKAYYEGEKELFDGLAISKMQNEWVEYPVIHIDLNSGHYNSLDNLVNQLDYILKAHEAEYGLDSAQLGLGLRFDRLIKTAYAVTGRKVVVLIDEYDKPLLSNIGNAPLQEQLRDLLRAFFSVLKSLDDNLQFVMLTGVTKYGRLSVFSGLNNLNDISFMPKYATLCGISEQELLLYFKEGISRLSMNYDCTEPEMVMRLREMYDGYRFTSADKHVFNPFSLLIAFDHEEMGSYWFETGTPKFLVDVLKANRYEVSNLEGAIADKNMLNSMDTFGDNPLAAIYQSGYLTIKKYDKENEEFTLGFPNQEVRKGFLEYILPYYIDNPAATSSFDIRSFTKDLRFGHAKDFMQRLKALTADISYEIQVNCENDFQNLLYIIFSISSQEPLIERRTSDGRIDMVVESSNFVYVMEFKVDGSAEEALSKINDKGYTLPWSKDHRKVIKIGVNFSTVERRITDYLIES